MSYSFFGEKFGKLKMSLKWLKIVSTKVKGVFSDQEQSLKNARKLVERIKKVTYGQTVARGHIL
jgi:hypothetical protein